MTWDEYYVSCYDWAESTMANRISALTDFGSSEEIAEVAQEFYEDKHARRLIKKALAYGVRFKAEEIMDLSLIMDKATLSKMVETSAEPLNREQLEEIYTLVEDDIFNKASKRAKIDIFADDEEDGYDSFNLTEEKPKKISFFNALCLLFGVSDNSSHSSLFSSDTSHRHNGRCNGDCANCPPHYGYRYGRWYYGHHHTRSCEFGGNKGI